MSDDSLEFAELVGEPKAYPCWLRGCEQPRFSHVSCHGFGDLDGFWLCYEHAKELSVDFFKPGTINDFLERICVPHG